MSDAPVEAVGEFTMESVVQVEQGAVGDGSEKDRRPSGGDKDADAGETCRHRLQPAREPVEPRQ
jgi:hypothetical protein